MLSCLAAGMLIRVIRTWGNCEWSIDPCNRVLLFTGGVDADPSVLGFALNASATHTDDGFGLTVTVVVGEDSNVLDAPEEKWAVQAFLLNPNRMVDKDFGNGSAWAHMLPNLVEEAHYSLRSLSWSIGGVRVALFM
eukprot:gb/GEZN01013718.1/.p1 GENE.gb/GEZN01013718.1/~~gb/GEZN01013718.1/.p1  ORF type:complete len:136 (-),score=17.35 gb/GEZN01013718.1/:93-500(-)